MVTDDSRSEKKGRFSADEPASYQQDNKYWLAANLDSGAPASRRGPRACLINCTIYYFGGARAPPADLWLYSGPDLRPCCAVSSYQAPLGG
ncbi:hypothetical protein EVAR_7494_1 [Eumeta japonica]|uniref:Uncharacterized protein n=1 Tax=Eumeta variegata TaxID=151549 RepID=A0A4C1Y6P9_EUMVA|nr:hypothetical protein EVAR_7494_1 [Eumeta japonica]